MLLRYIRKRLRSIEAKLTLRKQTLIIVSVLVVIVVVNQLVIFRAFTPGMLQSEIMGGISYFTLLISVGAAAIGGLTIVLFEKSMLSRIIKFNKDVKTISEKKDFSARVDLNGTDEIGQLAGNINHMLVELERVHGDLQQSNCALECYQRHLQKKVQEQVKEIARLLLGSIESLISALEAKDEYTAGHSRRVAQTSVMIGKHLELSADELDDLRWGALLHDVGKIAVNPSIQNKPGKLTQEEYEHLMIHVRKGVDIVGPVANERVLQIIRHHHSRYDGTGLNQTQMAGAIPLGARIVAVADTFDSITSDRPYRRAKSVSEAVKEILRCSSTQFEPEVVNAFLSICPSISVVENHDVVLV
ncbi:HD domain-containing phosphohydrolase [Chloroflexota bacterium]